MPKSDLQNKTLDELETMLRTYMKESMNLRFQKSMGQLEKPSRVKVVRKEIAKINTFLNLKRKKENA
jgi:large subunit ribosomal protein L29